MPLSAWLMLIFGCVILYGGLGLFIGIAIKKSRAKAASLEQKPEVESES